MRSKTIRGKLVQLREARPSLWWAFISGWLSRGRNGFVPAVVPGASRLLRIPCAEFYESYFFFCEVDIGRREVSFFLNQLGRTEVFYDIGSFRGVYAAMAKARLQDRLAVHAFEPLPKNYEAIQRIAALNAFRDFTVNPLAVGDGTALAGRVNEQDGMLRLGDNQAAAAETKFQAVSLDDYIARGNPPPTIMKIDVDGFELQVLQGAQRCLRESRPRLWLEVHPGYLQAQGRTDEEVLKQLREIGYTLSFSEDKTWPTASIAYHVWCV